MNDRQTIRARTSCALVLAGAMGLMHSSLAQSPGVEDDVKFLGAYNVLAGQTTEPDHEDAEILVFKSQLYPRKRFGLVFVQTKEPMEKKKKPLKDSGFTCSNGRKLKGQNARRCIQYGEDENGDPFLEVLTIGKLGGGFCDSIKGKDQYKEKVKDWSCPAKYYDKCICYEIKTLKDVDRAFVELRPDSPPGNGAGVGGSH